MQDRLQVPERLEKAIGYLKEMPPEQEVGAAKARTWEQVSRRGRRARLWQAGKPVTGAAAVAAAVAMFFVLPNPFGDVDGLGPQQEVQVQADQGKTPAAELNAYFQERQKQYRKEGFQLMSIRPDLGTDVIKNNGGIYVVQDGRKMSVLQYPVHFELHEYLEFHPALDDARHRDVRNQALAVLNEKGLEPNESAVYLLDLKKWSATKLPIYSWVDDAVYWERDGDRPTLAFATTNLETGEQRLQAYDMETGELTLLTEWTGDRVMRLHGAGRHLVMATYYDILYHDGEELVSVAKSKQAEYGVIGVFDDEILYRDGAIDNLSPHTSYKGDVQVVRYGFDTRKSEPLLPSMEGDQQFITSWGGTAEKSSDGYLISNFVADPLPQGMSPDDRNRPGTLEIWRVEKGQATEKIYDKKTVLEEAGVFPTWVGSSQDTVILSPVPQQSEHKWRLQVELRTGNVRELPPSNGAN